MSMPYVSMNFQEGICTLLLLNFGTLGDDIKGQIGNPRAMMFENRLYWHGVVNDKLTERVKHDFEELFNPAAANWRVKAIADSDQAFMGILKAEGYLSD